jgi:hypothetical protein
MDEDERRRNRRWKVPGGPTTTAVAGVERLFTGRLEGCPSRQDPAAREPASARGPGTQAPIARRSPVRESRNSKKFESASFGSHANLPSTIVLSSLEKL